MAASSHQSASAAILNQTLHGEPRRQHSFLQHKEHIHLPLSSFHGWALSMKPLMSQAQCRLWQASFWASSTNEVAVAGSRNAAAVVASQLEAKLDEETPKEPLPTPKEVTISSIMADVANLVKLVDSRDIVELELKHYDYELVIRKTEALAPPASTHTSFPPPQVFAHAPYPTYAPPPPPPAAASAPPAPPAPPVQSSAPSAAPAPASVADGPRILSPMAGTLYRSAAPGEPPFVKVGDKVQKGQVICIVEAMKLMNEIEADQSGTVVEIIAEDGKPVAVDTPLFGIKP